MRSRITSAAAYMYAIMCDLKTHDHMHVVAVFNNFDLVLETLVVGLVFVGGLSP
jgi:hypothetical protein